MLHAMADSFSHQQFSGEWSVVNELHRLRYIVRIRMMSSKFVIAVYRIGKAYFSRFIQWLLSLFAPEIGHARAGKIPDYPFAVWRYRNYDRKHISRSNPDIFFHCGINLFGRLKRLSIVKTPRLTDQEIRKTLRQAVYISGTMKRREDFWRYQIRQLSDRGTFPILSESFLNYTRTDWKELELNEKRCTMKVLKPREKPYRLKHTFSQFKQSHYYQFHEAARKQRIGILKMLKDSLPRVELALQETLDKKILFHETPEK